MSSIIYILAFAEGGSSPAILQFVPLLLVIAIFYFLLIAPMRKRQKALQQLIDGLNKGDRVITNGGLYGTVVSVQEKAVLLKIADNVKVKVTKSSIAGLEGQEDELGSRK